MGWDINVSRIDFNRLLQVRGSKNERLLRQLVSAHALDEDEPDEYEDDDEEDEPRLSVKDALRNILFDTIGEEDTDPAYSDAMAILYEATAAEYIGDLRVAAWGITSFFQEVDAILVARGFPGYLSQLVLGGCPFQIPLEGDGALGFLTPADCSRFAAEYSRHDWSDVAPALRETIGNLRNWCGEAAKHGQGLVAVGG
jgi:hypothetical protein